MVLFDKFIKLLVIKVRNISTGLGSFWVIDFFQSLKKVYS